MRSILGLVGFSARAAVLVTALLAYLNIAGFGGNADGIEAASEEYYSTTAAKLTLAQAASLIAVVQQPPLRNPGSADNWERNKTRRDVILATNLTGKKITGTQYAEAIATPVDRALAGAKADTPSTQLSTSTNRLSLRVISRSAPLHGKPFRARQRPIDGAGGHRAHRDHGTEQGIRRYRRG